jgi:hypothetical protein
MDTDEPTAAAPESDSPDLTPSTSVRLSIRVALSILGGVVALVLSAAGGYYALAGTDRVMDAKVGALERKDHELEKRIDQAATKADLRELRLQVRNDLLSSVWECTNSGGGMQCRPRMPRTYEDAGE